MNTKHRWESKIYHKLKCAKCGLRAPYFMINAKKMGKCKPEDMRKYSKMQARIRVLKGKIRKDKNELNDLLVKTEF